MNEKLKVIISAEVDKLKQGVQDAKKAMKDFEGDTSKVSKAVEGHIKNMSTSIANGMKSLGTAIAAGGAALLGTAAATEEVRENYAKVAIAAQTAGVDVETATDAWNGFTAIMGDSDAAAEALQQTLKFSSGSLEDLAEWEKIAAGNAAMFGDALPIETLMEGVNETISLNEATGGLAQLIEQSGGSVEEFNKGLQACNSEAEQAAYVQNYLNGIVGEAGEQYLEATEGLRKQREAQQNLNIALGKLGAAMAPVLTALMEFASAVLDKVTPVIQELAEKYGPALSEAFAAAGEAVGNAFGFFVDHWEIFAAIAGIIGSIAAAILLYNTYLAISEGLAAAKIALNLAETASLTTLAAAAWAAVAPHLAIIAAIAAVIAIVVLCIIYWDEIKEVVVKVAKAIWEKVKEMVDKVVQFFTELMNKVKEKIEALKTAATEKFQAIKNAISEKVQAAKDAVITTFENIKSGIQSRIDAAKNAVSNVFNSIKSTITTVLNAAKSTVTSVFDGIKTGITDKINAAKTAVSNAINAIKGFFNFSWSLPKLKLPHISISGSFSINPPSVPKFSISWYAKGGIFDSPALFPYGNGQIGGLGEAGAEAIVPLEKNTKWLDKIAERLGAGQSAKIVLEVDGKVFAQTAISSINDLTRQQGKLSLNVI